MDNTIPEMTLRDYFAAKAMQGLLASRGDHDVESFDEIASDAYGFADAMMKRREFSLSEDA